MYSRKRNVYVTLPWWCCVNWTEKENNREVHAGKCTQAAEAKKNLQASSWCIDIFSLTCRGGLSILIVGSCVGGVYPLTAEILGEPLMASLLSWTLHVSRLQAYRRLLSDRGGHSQQAALMSQHLGGFVQFLFICYRVNYMHYSAVSQVWKLVKCER